MNHYIIYLWHILYSNYTPVSKKSELCPSKITSLKNIIKSKSWLSPFWEILYNLEKAWRNFMQYVKISVSWSWWWLLGNTCKHIYISLYISHAVSEKAMATHSSTLAWKIPWTEKPGRLQSMGSPRVGHDWATSLSLFTFMHWRRKWQPTPVFLPGESQGQGSLVGCPLWGCTESDTTEVI